MTAPAVFQCVPYNAKLTRTSCAAKYSDAQLHRREDPASAARMKSRKCEDCSVGTAHAVGGEPTTWDDGTPVELVQLGVARDPLPTPGRPAAAPIRPQPRPSRARREAPASSPAPSTPSPENASMPRPSIKYSLGNREVTAHDIAEETGVHVTAVHKRLRAGEFKAGESVQAVVDALRAVAGEKRGPKPSGRARSAPRAAEPRRAQRPARAELDREIERGIVGDVRSAIAATPVATLLERLGHEVEDLGVQPNGMRLLLVREAS